LFPTQHAAAAALAVVPLRRRGWSWRDLALFSGAAVLIDVDHYLSYVWQYHDFSLLNAYRFHHSRVPREGVTGFRLRLPNLWPRGHRPFHAVSVLLSLFLAARWMPLLWPVACGATFHHLQDTIWECFTTRDGAARD